MENKPKCKNCGYDLIDQCGHQACLGAQAQGFCSVGCKEVYFQIRDRELERAKTN